MNARVSLNSSPASSGLLMVPITSSSVTTTAGVKTGKRMVALGSLLDDSIGRLASAVGGGVRQAGICVLQRSTTITRRLLNTRTQGVRIDRHERAGIVV